MVRWSVLAGCAAVVAGAAFVTGATTGPAKPPLAAEARGEGARALTIGQRTGYFNMAKVMSEYNRAKTAVVRLEGRKNRLATNIVGLRAMYADLQARHARTADPDQKFDLESDMRALGRRIEDADRNINKLLNDRATVVITELHDEIRAVVAAVARENGLTAVLAFPDAVTPQQAEQPQIKELKLKPPALQPFYLDPSVDYSDEIVRRLNDRFADEDDK